LKKIGSDELLAQAFSYFDKNNSGYIEFDELSEALLDDKLGPANEKVIQDIIFDVDLDKVILKHIHLILFTSLRTFMIVLCNIIGTNLVGLFFRYKLFSDNLSWWSSPIRSLIGISLAYFGVV
jgi:hypothetical protein